MHGTLGALPGFLRFLVTFPGPDAVVRAMVNGPLAALGAQVAALQVRHESDLVTVGVSGDDMERSLLRETYPLAADMPVVRAYQTDETVIVPLAAMWSDFAAAPAHRDRLEAALGGAGPQSLGSAAMVSAVVSARGVRVGTWWAVCAERAIWSPTDLALVDAVSAAVGLWLTSAEASASVALKQQPRTGALRISGRQQQILLMVEEGKTNMAIAAALGFSESTVKLELRKVLEKLRVTDRTSAVRTARAYGLLEEHALAS